MCRHLAYLGRPRPLRELILDPPNSLLEQSYVPKRQRHGHVNVDGFGIGWYADGDPVPARYRRAIPIWADPSLGDLARVVRSGAVLAAVRCGSVGMPHGEVTCAPFGYQRFLFSLNGAVHRWRELSGELSAEELVSLDAPTDAVLLWMLTVRRLRAGATLPGALAEITALAGPLTDRLNLLLTDGAEIAATAFGESLSWRETDSGVAVASEPYDEEHAWHDVPDNHLLHVTPDGVRLERLS
jgi:glutamine amidotransferase